MRSGLPRSGPSAYWASWADTLPMMAARCPELAATCRRELEQGDSRAQSLREAEEARRALHSVGYDDCPTWTAVQEGLRPPKVETAEPGETTHGWQYHSSSRVETHFREDLVRFRLGRAHTALLRSQSGPCAGVHLTALPRHEETKWRPEQLRVLLLRRLRLPLQLGPRSCRCGRQTDTLGDHRAACNHAGVLQGRAVPLERM